MKNRVKKIGRPINKAIERRKALNSYNKFVQNGELTDDEAKQIIKAAQNDKELKKKINEKTKNLDNEKLVHFAEVLLKVEDSGDPLRASPTKLAALLYDEAANRFKYKPWEADSNTPPEMDSLNAKLYRLIVIRHSDGEIKAPDKALANTIQLRLMNAETLAIMDIKDISEIERLERLKDIQKLQANSDRTADLATKIVNPSVKKMLTSDEEFQAKLREKGILTKTETKDTSIEVQNTKSVETEKKPGPLGISVAERRRLIEEALSKNLAERAAKVKNEGKKETVPTVTYRHTEPTKHEPEKISNNASTSGIFTKLNPKGKASDLLKKIKPKVHSLRETGASIAKTVRETVTRKETATTQKQNDIKIGSPQSVNLGNVDENYKKSKGPK